MPNAMWGKATELRRSGGMTLEKAPVSSVSWQPALIMTSILLVTVMKHLHLQYKCLYVHVLKILDCVKSHTFETFSQTRNSYKTQLKSTNETRPELHSPGASVLSEGWLQSRKLCDKTQFSAKPPKYIINHAGDAERVYFQTHESLADAEKWRKPDSPFIASPTSSQITKQQFWLFTLLVL